MHYTSIENIHKVIDPLFLDDLKAKLEKIKQYKLTSDGKYFIVNAKTEEEAIEKVKKITNKEVNLSNIKFKVDWIKVN